MFSLLVSLLLFSNVRVLVKVVLLLMTVGISLFFLHHNLFSMTPLVFVSIIALLCLPGGHPMATNIWFIIVAVIMVVYTLARQFPAMVLLAVLVTLLLASYVIFLTMFAYHSLDSPAFTVYLSVIYLAWYAWLHNETRLRFT